jgi:hypothetical protein
MTLKITLNKFNKECERPLQQKLQITEVRNRKRYQKMKAPPRREGKVELQEKRVIIFTYSRNLSLFRLFTHTHTGFWFPTPTSFKQGGGEEYFLCLLCSVLQIKFIHKWVYK